jgi:hypothetical protein
MKKRFLLLTAVGFGAGLIYAFKGKFGARADEATEGGLENNKSEQTRKTSRNGRGLQSNTVSARSTNSENEGVQRPGSSMGRIDDGALDDEREPEIDDRGTHQSEASDILKNIRDGAFDSSDEKLALALGRPKEEIEEWTRGAGTIDGDVVMKARALAIQRGVEIE